MVFQSFKDDGNLVSDYLSITNDMRENFGIKTILFMQVGKFYEIYDLTKEDSIQLKVCENLLNLTVTRTNRQCQDRHVYMCGVPADKGEIFDRSLRNLLANGFTIVKMSQRNYEGNDTLSGDAKVRYIDCIYSPGCNITEDSSNSTLVAILILENEVDFSIHYSKFDTTLGQIQHWYGQVPDLLQAIKHMTDFLYEVEECNELIIYHSMETKLSEFEKQCNFNVISQHMCDLKQTNHDYVFNENFQLRFLKDIYKTYNYMGGDIFEHLGLDRTNKNMNACLIFLIRFVRQHDEKLIHKIYPPTKYTNDDSTKVQCINSLFEKVDLFTPGKGVFALLGKQKTKMGERLLRTYLRCPTSNQEELKKRYDLTDYFTSFPTLLEPILGNINDLERLGRKFSIHKAMPCDIYKLYVSIEHILKLVECIDAYQLTQNVLTIMMKIKFEIDEKLNLEECSQNSFGIQENYFPEISCLKSEYKVLENNIKDVVNLLEQTFVSVCGSSNHTPIVNLHQTAGGDQSLQTTSKRGKVLEKVITNESFQSNLASHLKFENVRVSYKNNTASIHGEFEQYLDDLNDYRQKIHNIKKEKFDNICVDISSLLNDIVHEICKFVATIDLHYTLAKFYMKNAYTRPSLSNDPGSLYAKSIRHPLIERIAKNEGKIYVPNDVYLTPMNCWMLHGVNSVGKSSLLKSIMINVILAQAGLFVAAEAFNINPFSVIGCRIGNNDDLFCGQSSFVKETLEMSLILRKAMKTPSLIITDEMCSSTESKSAIKVVASFIQILSERRITFACATHLFELQKNKYIQGLKNLKNLHLSVEFDDDALTFTRLVKPGLPESQDYGTAVSKVMIQDKRFKELIDSEWHDAVDINDSQTTLSVYNKKSVKVCCEICQYQPKKVTDAKLHTHHINFQCTADAHGNVGNGLFKHDLPNLVTVCQLCHVKIHDYKIMIRGFKDTSNGSILDYYVSDVS